MTLYTSNRDGGKTNEEGHYRFHLKSWSGNILSGFAITQNSPLGMSVLVGPGDARVEYSTYGFTLWNSANAVATITTADPSNPRIDRVVVYIDLGAAPQTVTPNNPAIPKIAVVAGTAAGSPTKANDAAVQSAVGSGNPWFEIATVAVAAGVTTISNGNITDSRVFTQPKGVVYPVYDHVESGIVITGDSYGSNRNASMSSGVVYINGKRLTVAAVSARTYTASKDTYVDLVDNMDGTAVPAYSESTNNAASQPLAANSIRVGIVVTGASNIANSGSVNQGEQNKVLPIASSIAYSVTDSLGNLICPRDPNRKLLGYRQILSDFSTASTSPTQVTGLSCPVIVPSGRKVKVSLGGQDTINSSGGFAAIIGIWDGTVGSGTRLAVSTAHSSSSNYAVPVSVMAVNTPSSTSKTYNAALNALGAGTVTIDADSTGPAYIIVELL